MTSARRRALLRAIAAGSIPLAGCLRGEQRQPTDTSVATATATESATPTATDTPTPAADTDTPFSSTDGPLDLGDAYRAPDGWTVAVRDVHVSKLVRTTTVGNVAHVDVGCFDGQQFAVVDAGSTDGDDRSPLTDVPLSFEVDGVRYPLSNQQMYWAFPPGSSERPGRPAFAVPVASAGTAAVVWLRDGDPVMRWRLPDETVEAFGAAPSFEVGTFETPDSVRRGSTVEAAFTVANTGDRDGRFVAEFGVGPVSDHDEVVVEVPAGAERSHAATLDPQYTDDADEVAVTLDWGCERRRRSVSVTD